MLNAQELCDVTSGDEVLIIGDGPAGCLHARLAEQALRCAAPRGRVSLYGGLPPGTPPPSFDTNHVHYRELTVSGTSGASPAQTARALGLIASGAVPVTDLITHRYPLAQLASALTTMANGQAIKVTIEP